MENVLVFGFFFLQIVRHVLLTCRYSSGFHWLKPSFRHSMILPIFFVIFNRKVTVHLAENQWSAKRRRSR